MSSSLKTIAINVLVFFVLFNAIIWLICAGNSIYNLLDRSEVFEEATIEGNPHYIIYQN